MSKDAFVAEARQALFDPAFAFNLAPLAARGWELGAITPAERNGMEARSELPAWLRAELGLDGRLPAATQYDDVAATTGEVREVPAPVLLGGWLPAAFRKAAGRTPDVHVISGGAARVVTANFLGAVVTGDGLVEPVSRPDNLWGWQLTRERPAHRLPGHALLATVEGSAVFTHWLLDTLPRFKVLELLGLDVRDFDHVMVATAGAPFHQESLKALGVGPRKVVGRNRSGFLYDVDAFTHVTAPRAEFFCDDWVFDYVREVFGSPAPKAPHRRIYLSRAVATRRRVLNEEELLPVLARHGFEVVRAEELGVRGTAELFQEASHVIAPHGAGLANLVFMPRGGRVLEFFGPHLSPEYWRISGQRGLEHRLLQVGDADGAAWDQDQVAAMGFFERNFADLRVPVAEFEAAVEGLL